MIQCEGQTFLVTGGAGNLGSYVVEALAREGAARVVVVDNFYNGYLDNLAAARAIDGCEIVVVNADISEHESLLPIFLQYRPIGVFNMASMLTLDCKKESRQAVQYNIVGTWNVVDCCLRSGVERLVHSSSASVFGEPRYLPVDEAHPFDNKLLYGATKIANEALLGAAWHEYGLRWVGLRYYNVYSERQRRGHLYTQVIPKWAHEITTSGRLTINDDGSQTMDLIHAEDVARANVAAMVSETNNEQFNIGTGVETSVRQLDREGGANAGLPGPGRSARGDPALCRAAQDPRHAPCGVRHRVKEPIVRPAIFLDRDGVLIENRERYIRRWSDVAFLPGALRAMAAWHDAPYAFVVVTNQSAIGRGMIDRGLAQAINDGVRQVVWDAGGRIDAVYLCPHRPDEGCVCRKPSPGMLIHAAEELELDLSASWMIGDALTDLQAGEAVGARTILVRTGRGAAQAAEHGLAGVHDLADALARIDASARAVPAKLG